MLEINEQCKNCFHYQVCANILKQQLFIREKMLKEESPKCEYYLSNTDATKVVRCKDCVHWWSPMEDDAHYCRFKNGLGGLVAEEDYCSFGKHT